MDKQASQIKVGAQITFGVSRVMTVTATRDLANGIQHLSLVGPRGGIASALAHPSGRVRML